MTKYPVIIIVSSVTVCDMEYSEEVVAAIPELSDDEATLWR